MITIRIPRKVKDDIDNLIELGINCVPVTLGSLLNTFEDMKKDYYKETRNRWYYGATYAENGEIIHIDALYVYCNSKYNYVIHFFDTDNPKESKECKLTDNVLIYKVFLNNKVLGIKRYLFLNTYYSDDSTNKYSITVNKQLEH